ncbi:ribonuclease T [Thiomicrorhabdus lithotrophica]|uniref:Ribonuclease T n=1 Tax=Thiomicrorhabdus lithotrophica TaxID=2949997 RepID=A0ABY8C7S2_9GAMM|nr:ribonuclease T [Thiomicrorhabdus lithotrophica]WEJ62015.1 ribonuclease T [Thiomicrorhabdus lithotrophica]
MSKITQIKDRFRGFLPVVVDVETAGFNANTDALLEMAVVTLKMDENGILSRDQTIDRNILPFEGANLEESALKFIGMEDPYHPFRNAVHEKRALNELFAPIQQQIKATGCSRAILVGHNAFFDLNFVQQAAERCKIKSPFHEFSTFDTVSLSGLAYGQTVLAKAAVCAGMEWDNNQAHSAVYDTEKTADLFCKIVNQWPIEVSSTAD